MFIRVGCSQWRVGRFAQHRSLIDYGVLPMWRSPKRVKRVPRHGGDLASLRPLRKLTFNGINDDLKNLMTTSRSRSWDLRHQMIIVEVQMVWKKGYSLCVVSYSDTLSRVIGTRCNCCHQSSQASRSKWTPSWCARRGRRKRGGGRRQQDWS